MLENNDDYKKKIEDYVFRDLKLSTLSRKPKLKHLVLSM